MPFLTKPAIARAMLARALDAGVPCEWVLGDEVYGADRRLRAMLEERGKPYLLTIRSNDALEAELDGGVGRHEAAALARALPPRAWRRLSAGAGTKGERLYDWARVRLLPPPDGGGDAPPRERWLLVRRSIADPADLAYFVVFAPAGLRLLDLARVAGRRWLVEECFEAAKQEVGPGGLRGAELARLAPARHPGDAGARPARRAAGRPEQAKGGTRAARQPLVPLSVPEVRRLITRLAPGRGPPAPAFVLAWSFWRRAHQAVAQACHWGRRLMLVQPQL